MAKKIRTHACILLDRSTSMTRGWSATVKAINEWADTMFADDKLKVSASLRAFSYSPAQAKIVERVRSAVSRKNWQPIDEAELQPIGMTPLCDATALTIKELEKTAESYDRIALIVVTDGQENMSSKFSQADVCRLVADKEMNGWLIQFIGIDIDAWDVSRNVGTASAQTISVDRSRTHETFVVSADKVRKFSQTGNTSAAAYSHDDREKLKANKGSPDAP